MSYQDWYKQFLENMLHRYISLEKSLSILIQGPLHERMRESIPLYLDIVKRHQHFQSKLPNNPYSKNHSMGNLVISYWDNDDESIINDYKSNKDIFLLKNNSQEVSGHSYKAKGRGSAPWVYQNYSSYYGVKSCTGYLCIKVRSDEFYPSLENFYLDIKKENETPGTIGKYTTSDIFFRKDSVEKFHPSDHIIGGPSYLLKSGFQTSLYRCKQKIPEYIKFPEQLICRSFLESRNVDVKDYKSKEIMKKYFRIYPIKNMPNSIWTCSYRNYAPLKSTEPGWLHDIDQI